MDDMQLDIWDLMGEEIPNDDFRESLRRGSGYEGGRIRIYAAINLIPDRKQLAEFIREEYGTGGHSYTFSDGTRGFIDYDSKNYRMRKWGQEESEKKYSWRQVADAVLEIARKNLYLNRNEQMTFGRLLAEAQTYGRKIPMPTPRMHYTE